MRKRPEREIAGRASQVLDSFDMRRLPVNPLAIARQEEIELAPGVYGQGFDGRIRYLSMIDTFVLAYRQPGPGRPEGRVRFTIGHELGHYYLHNEYLLSGRWHSSTVDFRSNAVMEQEADEFAAHILMPLDLFRAEVRQFRGKFCLLKDLCELAEKRVVASLTSTVRRYCQADIEPCSVVFSENGVVKWANHSEDMRRLGMGFFPFGDPIPRGSRTAGLWADLEDAGWAKAVEGSMEPTVWFERTTFHGMLWEEAMPLGNTGVVLTYLTLKDALG
jgi:hypothetical protein